MSQAPFDTFQARLGRVPTIACNRLICFSLFLWGATHPCAVCVSRYALVAEPDGSEPTEVLDAKIFRMSAAVYGHFNIPLTGSVLGL